jgi:hypothetical protein
MHSSNVHIFLLSMLFFFEFTECYSLYFTALNFDDQIVHRITFEDMDALDRRNPNTREVKVFLIR